MALGMHCKDQSLWSLLIVLVVKCYQIRSDHNHGLYDQIIKTGLYHKDRSLS